MSSSTNQQVSGFSELRQQMVERQIRPYVRDQRVLDAMARVPRHLFVPEHLQAVAYADGPLPIGHGQTISQPLMVARMLEVARFRGDERVLEVGTGSGYQAALLGELAREVWTIEIVGPLAEGARNCLSRIAANNVTVVHGDGGGGYAPAAPYDVIIVAAAPDRIPPRLLYQLVEGGRLIIPVGPHYMQQLQVVTRRRDEIELERLEPCTFVPLVGSAQDVAADNRDLSG